MPSKFRRTLWVRRGNFVILRPIEEGDKVRAEIVHVLDTDNIAYLIKKEQWPDKFADEAKTLTSRRVEANDEKSADDMFPSTSEEEDECSEEEVDEER